MTRPALLARALAPALALALAACAPIAQPVRPTHTPAAPREHPNVALALAPETRTPLVQGAHWTYGHPTLPAEHTLHIEHARDDRALLVHQAPDGTRELHHLLAPERGALGVFLVETQAHVLVRYDPPLQLLPPEAELEIGASWGAQHLVFAERIEHVEHRASVLTRQIVSVPAGEAIAYQIHHTLTRSVDGVPQAHNYTLWYAPYVGFLNLPDGAVLQRALLRSE